MQLMKSVPDPERLGMASAPTDPWPANPTLVTASPAMAALAGLISVVAKSLAPVVILGETGTGKEVVARELRALSGRSGRPMVCVNCAALPDALLEAEFFGHAAGAFTGAQTRRVGRFQAADGGTLFLDEIGELSRSGQGKLLRVLETGTFEPLGSNESVRVDVRLICATHCDLKRLVDEGRFRADLCYRINVAQLHVPPLRQRPEDIPVLIDAFVKAATPASPRPRLTPAAYHALLSYDYPGNVRELRHAVAFATVLAGEGPIEVSHLPAAITTPAERPRNAPKRPENTDDLGSLATAMAGFERQHIMRALAACHGHRGRTAELLGVSRKYLWQRVRLYGAEAAHLGDGRVHSTS